MLRVGAGGKNPRSTVEGTSKFVIQADGIVVIVQCLGMLLVGKPEVPAIENRQTIRRIKSNCLVVIHARLIEFIFVRPGFASGVERIGTCGNKADDLVEVRDRLVHVAFHKPA